jgi:hypothetical protein
LAVAIFSLGLIRDALWVFSPVGNMIPASGAEYQLILATSELYVNNPTMKLLPTPLSKLPDGDS